MVYSAAVLFPWIQSRDPIASLGSHAEKEKKNEPANKANPRPVVN